MNVTEEAKNSTSRNSRCSPRFYLLFVMLPGLLLSLWAADRKAVMFVTHDLEEAIALADRVVLMSAGPAAGIIGDFPVTLPRPRDIAEVRMEPTFHHIHKEIWASLRVEVQKAYSQGEGA